MLGYNLSYATLPEARRKMANKVRALNLMMKMIATWVPDFDQWERIATIRSSPTGCLLKTTQIG